MKTLDKLRALVVVTLCFLSAMLLLMSRGPRGLGLRTRLEYEELVWKQRHQQLDFKRIKWNRILRVEEWRENENPGGEEEIDLNPDFPAQLEVLDGTDDDLQEIRKASRLRMVVNNEVQGRSEEDNQQQQQGGWDVQQPSQDGRGWVQLKREGTNVGSVREDLEQNVRSSLIFKPAGLRFVVDQKPMPLLLSDRCPKGFVPDPSNPVFDSLKQCDHASLVPAEVEQWRHSQVMQCGGHLSVFNKEMALLQDVIMDKAHSSVVTKDTQALYSPDLGSHSITKYHLELGFFKVYCPTGLDVFGDGFRGGESNHLSRWLFVTEPFTLPMSIDFVVTQVTIATARQKPDSLLHTLCDLYNAYLTMRFLNLTANDVVVLFVDSHPYNPLDSLWNHMFQFKTNIGSISERTHFYTMIWNTIGRQSHFLDTRQGSLGYVEEFGDHVLGRYGISSRKPLNCNNLNILLILRRNYVDSEGRISRRIRRKIDNEEELYYDLVERFGRDHVTVNGTQLDLLPLGLQLDHVSQTDILIGAHGAGLAHALFLPRHAAVLEIFPGYMTKRPRDQFNAICKWRGLLYDRWTNTNPQQESRKKQVFSVDSKSIVKKVENLKRIMCPFVSPKNIQVRFRQERGEI